MMVDEVLKELWDAKDTIAKEHGYSVDRVAEYFLKKQAVRQGKFHCPRKGEIAEKGAPADTRTSRD